MASDYMGQAQKKVSASQAVFDFAVDVCRYRVLGNHALMGGWDAFLKLEKRARSVAATAAVERLPMQSAITELFWDQGARHGGTPTLGWQYERAYRAADARIDPRDYFAMDYSNGSVTVTSRGIACAQGQITFAQEYAAQIFRCAQVNSPSSYLQWAEDPYPVGGHFLLQRFDQPGDEEYGQLRIVVEDVHPCRGAIRFGEPCQELDQLGAFLKLRAEVNDLFAANAVSQDQRAAAAHRAKAIIQMSGYSFMPISGFCSTCHADVTHALANVKKGHGITGCPLCGSSWCD